MFGLYCYMLLKSSLFITYLECPIKGQIRKECASHSLCHHTCDNLNESRPCPLVCVINGCECPTGTVIDVDKRECVAPSKCPGKLCHTSLFNTELLICTFILHADKFKLTSKFDLSKKWLKVNHVYILTSVDFH